MDVGSRAREMLAAEYEVATDAENGADVHFSADNIRMIELCDFTDWKERAAIRAIEKALSREEEIRAEEREPCEHLLTLEKAMDALSDPTAVHLNMLRGGIAKPSPVNIWHLYGGQALIDAMPESAKAAIRDSAPADDGWQPIETAPNDEAFMVGLWVTNNKTGQRWWESYFISIDDETGEAISWPEGEPLPWGMSSFTHWRPLLAPPSDSGGRNG